jgi:hypothetical protein
MTTTTDRHPHPGDRYIGQPITSELLRAEATRLDATNAGGPASWIMGEVACLLRRVADVDHTGTAVAIVLALGHCDPVAYDSATGQGVRCALCDATPPGAAHSLLDHQHEADCPWWQAQDLASVLAAEDHMAGWPAPDGPPDVWEQCRQWDQEVNGR